MPIGLNDLSCMGLGLIKMLKLEAEWTAQVGELNLHYIVCLRQDLGIWDAGVMHCNPGTRY